MFYSCERSSEPWLESKQTTLSSHHCSQHAGFIATLSSMATTRLCRQLAARTGARACRLSYSTNILFFMLTNEDEYSLKFNMSLTSLFILFLLFWFISMLERLYCAAVTEWRLYTKPRVSRVTGREDKPNGTNMQHTDVLSLYICSALQCKSICIITHSHQELCIPSHSPISSPLPSVTVTASKEAFRELYKLFRI